MIVCLYECVLFAVDLVSAAWFDVVRVCFQSIGVNELGSLDLNVWMDGCVVDCLILSIFAFFCVYFWCFRWICNVSGLKYYETRGLIW